MNVWQICQALQTILRAKTWTGGTAPVFDRDSVRVISQGDEIEALNENLIPPLCIISPLSGELDPQHREEPDYVRRLIDVTLVTVNMGDRVGEAPIMGANRADAITSPGQGVLQIEQHLFDAIAKLNVQHGIIIQFAAQGEGQVRRDQANNFIGMQDYTFEVWCSTTPEYPAMLAVSAIGGTGDAEISWTIPAAAGPLVSRVELRRATGATPPATISAGTLVTSWTSLPTSPYPDVGLLPATYSYSMFIVYSNPGSTADDHVAGPTSSGAVIVS